MSKIILLPLAFSLLIIMQHLLLTSLKNSIQAQEAFAKEQGEVIIALARQMVKTIRQGGKILLFGNGGSAADAQHLAAEFVNRFLINRRPMAALALTTDSSVLTSIGNDFSFDEIFVKQVQALGKPEDLALGISTSGGSVNVLITSFLVFCSLPIIVPPLNCF